MARILILSGLFLAAISPRPGEPAAAVEGSAALIASGAAAAPAPIPVDGGDSPLALPPVAGAAADPSALAQLAAPPPRAVASPAIPLLSLAPKQSPPPAGSHRDHLDD